jgi:hypothetical protein
MNTRICPACGHANSQSRQSCKQCRSPLYWAAAADTGPDSVAAPVNGYSLDLMREGELAPPSTDREYIVVPFVGQIRRNLFSSQSAQDVSNQLQAVINERARQGWLFCSVEKIDIHVTPGCLASLFGARSSVISFDQVIFRWRGAELQELVKTLEGESAEA